MRQSGAVGSVADSLELKVPPAVVAGLAGVAQWFLTRRRRRTMPLGAAAAASLAAAGVTVGVQGIVGFQRARTTVHPQHPEQSTALVTDGVNARTRNPMYVAMGLGLLGVAAFTGRAVALLPIVGYVAWLDRFQVQPEERVLAERFGEVYDDYRQHVRRWV